MKYCALLVFACLLLSLEAESQSIRIWDGTQVRNRSVTLTPYLPDEEESSGIGVIVCPGGSYFWLDTKNEGVAVSEWLKDNGCAAFLLKYRTAGWYDFVFRSRSVFGGNRFPDMFEDIQRALQIVREESDRYGINPDKVGVIGFSAGGHLSLSSAVYSDTDYLSPIGVSADVPLCPDFVAAIYPVVSMSDEGYVHKRSRRGLLGEKKQKDTTLQDSLSIEKHVGMNLPPVFLLSCEDDPVVDDRNSVILDSALTANNVNHRYIHYRSGGHGFGANADKMNEETILWQDEFLSWLNGINL